MHIVKKLLKRVMRKVIGFGILIYIGSNLSGCVAEGVEKAATVVANTESYILETLMQLETESKMPEIPVQKQETTFSLSMPDYSGEDVLVLNGNTPYFTEMTTDCFEEYGSLDALGRCTACFACVGKDTMPTEPRGEIGQIKPTGWNQNKYPGIVPTEPAYLMNRCHLLAYCLTAENDNEKNLISGTRYLNEQMEDYEILVARYIDKYLNNHVMYRVTPVFDGDNLFAKGVLMEAASVEDEEIRFCVFIYNIQPGIIIDYTDGSNKAAY